MNTLNHFTVPIVPLKDGDQFIISCDALGIYAQAPSFEIAKEEFEVCINMLLGKWEKEGSLEARLRALGLIDESAIEYSFKEKDKKKSKLGALEHMMLQLGSVSNLKGSLVTA